MQELRNMVGTEKIHARDSWTRSLINKEVGIYSGWTIRHLDGEELPWGKPCDEGGGYSFRDFDTVLWVGEDWGQGGGQGEGGPHRAEGRAFDSNFKPKKKLISLLSTIEINH